MLLCTISEPVEGFTLDENEENETPEFPVSLLPGKYGIIAMITSDGSADILCLSVGEFEVLINSDQI